MQRRMMYYPFSFALRRRRRRQHIAFLGFWFLELLLLLLLLLLLANNNHVFANSSSSSSSNPRKTDDVRLGLEVAGKMKCLIYGPGSLRDDSSVPVPLFPSFSNTNERRLVPSIYGTAAYRFQQDRWYGLTRLGTILRWRIQGSDKNNDTHHLEQLYPQSQKPNPYLPRTLDLVSEKRVGRGSSMVTSYSSSSSPPSLLLSSLVDTNSIRLDWEDGDEEEGGGQSKPSVELCLNHSSRLARFRWFLPVCQRLHWHCTSRFSWDGDAQKRPKAAAATTTTTITPPTTSTTIHNPDWWIPTFKVDPFGLVTSETKYTRLFHDRYDMLFRLRISRSIRFGLSGLLDDDDENDDTTRVRLECRMVDKLHRHPFVSTARLESNMVQSSDWLRSIADSTRLVLLHEHSVN